MSKERARRRAEREAARAAEQAVRLRRQRRRARRAALMRRLTPARRGRWAWGLGRRSPAQRAIIAGAGILPLLAVWFLVDSLPNRIGLTVLVLILLPVLVVIAFDRKGMRL